MQIYLSHVEKHAPRSHKRYAQYEYQVSHQHIKWTFTLTVGLLGCITTLFQLQKFAAYGVEIFSQYSCLVGLNSDIRFVWLKHGLIENSLRRHTKHWLMNQLFYYEKSTYIAGAWKWSPRGNIWADGKWRYGDSSYLLHEELCALKQLPATHLRNQDSLTKMITMIWTRERKKQGMHREFWSGSFLETDTQKPRKEKDERIILRWHEPD
jgi:hypothetical protein